MLIINEIRPQTMLLWKERQLDNENNIILLTNKDNSISCLLYCCRGGRKPFCSSDCSY